jgi:NitT/TauT family transport system substrate-binding protein
MKSRIHITIIGALALVVLMAALLVIIAPTPTGQAVAEQEETLEKVRVGYRDHIYYLPAYVAQAQGYFTAEGLEAELIPYSSTNQLIEALLNGQIDAGIGGVNSIVLLTIEAKDPGRFLVFGQSVYSGEFDALIVREDSPIRSLENVRSISTVPGTSAKFWIENMLSKENLTGKVTIVQTNAEEQLSLLESGNVDAVHAQEPLVTIAVQKGIGRVLIQGPINKYYDEEGAMMINSVMSREFAERNPETAQAIIRATDRAVAYITTHPEESREYYTKFTPIEPAYAVMLPVAAYNPSDSMDSARFQQLADSYVEAGLMQKRVDTTRMFVP